MGFTARGSGRVECGGGRLWRLSLATALALALVPSLAHAATLSGKVSGEVAGGSAEALAGATVTVIDPESMKEVASTTTGALGEYSLEAPSGVFDVRVEPGPEQPFDPTTVHEVELTEARTLDVVLVARSTVALTGFVRDSKGAPIADAKVTLIGKSASAQQRTDANGFYSLSVLPGTYELSANGSGVFPVVPQSWAVQLGSISVQGNQSRDISLPTTSVLTVEALGAGDAPIAGANLTLPPMEGSIEREALGLATVTSGGFSGKTDAQGRAHFAVFTGAAVVGGKTATIFPPAGSGYGVASFSIPNVDQDTTVVVRFQGTVEDTQPPILTIDAEPNGQNGWFTSDPATATAHAKDAALASLTCAVGEEEISAPAGEGSETLDLAVLVAGEGRHQVVCVASDAAGNSTEASALVAIDVTAPPPAALSPDRPPDYLAEASWYRDQVTVSAVAGEDPPLADGSPGSGLDPASLPEPQLLSTSGSHEVVVAPRDLAGNVAGESALVVNVDATSPTSALGCPEDPLLGSSAVASWTDEDGESGLVGAATGVEALDTGEVGSHTALHVATDNVGHSSTSECAYRVVYPFAAAGKTVLPPQLNQRQGNKKKLSVEFSLGGDRGLQIFRAGHPQTQPIDCATGAPIGPSAPAAAAAPLDYKATHDAYEYTWDLQGLGQQGCVALLLGLVDGTTREVWLEL
jgi:hypothetical protein